MHLAVRLMNQSEMMTSQGFLPPEILLSSLNMVRRTGKYSFSEQKMQTNVMPLLEQFSFYRGNTENFKYAAKAYVRNSTTPCSALPACLAKVIVKSDGTLGFLLILKQD